MVAVGMSDKDVRHRLTAYSVEQSRYMRLVEWSRIDNGDFTFPDDIGHGPFERERPRIVAENSAHTRPHLLDLPGREIEALVKRNVVPHQPADGRSRRLSQ